MEAISHAGTVLGVLAKDGVVLAAEKKVTGKLLDLSGAKEGGYGGSGEKIYLLNSCVLLNLAKIYCTDSQAIVSSQKRYRWGCRIHGGREFAGQLRTHGGTTTSTIIQ